MMRGEIELGVKLTDHLFRVGGASLRWNVDAPIDEIVAVGPWKSKVYKLHIREFDEHELRDTLTLLRYLKFF